MIHFPRILLAGLACPALGSFQGPMDELVSSYPFGEQLALEVTPDRKLAFVAEGAAISIVDVGNVAQGAPPLALLPKIPMPDCQPLALSYYAPPEAGAEVDRYLFIAGGSHGVWRLTLCSSLFPIPPWGPLSCGPDPSIYAPTHIPPVAGGSTEGGYVERKRCVDVAVLPRQEDAILFALFAASSDPLQSAIGPSELHAWTVIGDTVTDLAHLTLDPTPPGAEPVQVGTALAIDPEDDDSVYVALGKGGIWRVDLAGTTLSKVQINIDWCQQPAPCGSCQRI